MARTTEQTSFMSPMLAGSKLIFRFEPFILAAECRDMSSAQKLVAVARQAGFRESGVTATKARTIAGIRCSLRLEVPYLLPTPLFPSLPPQGPPPPPRASVNPPCYPHFALLPQSQPLSSLLVDCLCHACRHGPSSSQQVSLTCWHTLPRSTHLSTTDIAQAIIVETGALNMSICRESSVTEHGICNRHCQYRGVAKAVSGTVANGGALHSRLQSLSRSGDLANNCWEAQSANSVFGKRQCYLDMLQTCLYVLA